MTQTRIIGFTGAAGAGKSTAARALVQARREACVANHKGIVLSLATPLKDVCKQMFPGAPASAFYGTQDEKETLLTAYPGWTGRRILQHIGTEGFRAVDPDIWANFLVHQIKGLGDEYGLIVIDDIRFINEAEILSDIAEIYRIDREGLAAMSHASEQEHMKIAVRKTLFNYGTLASFLTSLEGL